MVDAVKSQQMWKVIHFWRSISNFDYYIKDLESFTKCFEKNEPEQHLEVSFKQDLNLKDQSLEIATRANRILSALKMIMWVENQPPLKNLIISLVRKHQAYKIQVWSPT